MKIAFCSSEVAPFAKTGGLADVCGTLPLALEQLGQQIVIMMPFYGGIDGKKHGIKRIDDSLATATIGKDIQVYFVDHPSYFQRDGLYGNEQGDFPDNLERFQYFCWQALRVFKQLKKKVDIVHCHDWQTALIPAYLKFSLKGDEFYKEMKTAFTIHNLAYQGIFPKKGFPKLKLDQKLFAPDGFEFYDQINLLKGGILYSDRVTTVSKQYAREIQAPKLGCGLDGVLRSRKDSITGILNGIDYEEWDPRKDSWIEKTYSPENLDGKYVNKNHLQELFGLPREENIPLFGFVGRLSSQKGLDLVAQAMEEIGRMDVQLVFLGVGEEKYHRILKDMVARYPQKVAVHLKYDERLAHRVYAGSDLFLMPSVYEPCGLSQMISLRYGTIPLVFKTGGLADTVASFDAADGRGNGFVFFKYDKGSFIQAVKLAIKTYKDKKTFSNLVKRAFECRFSWTDSAQEYITLYEQCLSNHN